MNYNWHEVRLGEVLALGYGKALPQTDRKLGGKFPVYGANGVKARSDRFLIDGPSLIVGRKGSAGEVTLTDGPSWPLDVTYYVEFDKTRYSLRYLFHLLKHLDLPALATGVKPGINRDLVYSLPVKMPPLAEQERIVRILDEALDSIDTAQANTLTNIEGAEALFDAELAKVMEGYASVARTALGDICKTAAGGTPLKSDAANYENGDIPWILSGEVNQLEIWRATKFITNRGLENSSAKVFPKSTVLVAMYGATAGKVSILRTPASTNQAVCGIYPTDAFAPEFLAWYLRSIESQVVAQAQGNAQPNLSQAKIRKVPLPTPSLQEQLDAVHLIEAVLDATQDLVANLKRQYATYSTLRSALLREALEGF